MIKSRVSITRCKTYDTKEVEASVRRSVELIGGIERFIKPNSKVLIKPNLLSARSPEDAVDTHPEVVRAVSRIVKAVTPNVFVGDSPGGWALRDVDNVYEKSGMRRVCSEEALNLVKFDKPIYLHEFPIASILKEVDFIISVPKFKSHTVVMLTGAVKNNFGMVIGLHKAHTHLNAPTADKLASVVTRVFSIVKPTLSIMDGVIGMEGDGPSAGSARNFGIIMASQDAVSMDSVMAKIVGIDPCRVPTTHEAARQGLGIADLNNIEVVGEQVGDVAIKDFRMPKTFALLKLPRPIFNIGIKAINFYPHIRQGRCKRCALCFNICPKGAIKKTKKGAYVVNVKECIRCFCCHEVCPHDSIALKKSFFAKVLMR
jgi:uncharacterized protein (DUF362 family)/Pyruvate/2-oxoacid:ferredoxin oxidoreductase delta subunit